MNKEKIILGLLRLSMGFIFLWAFIDKLLGLNFATKMENAWINGGSPTLGFLSFGVKGPFVDIFHSIAGLDIVNWLFMLGLLFVGISLVFNKYVKYGAIIGAIMMFIIYLSVLLPENNPIIDEHIIYILVFVLLSTKNQDRSKFSNI